MAALPQTEEEKQKMERDNFILEMAKVFEPIIDEEDVLVISKHNTELMLKELTEDFQDW
jgi:hypothetical protein